MKHIKKYNDYFLFEAISVKQIKEQYKGMVIESGKIVLENYHEHCPIN